MKRRVFAAALAALLLTGCGSRGESGSASSQEVPEEPVAIGTLALELPAGGDADAARAFADSLPEAMAALGVKIGQVELSFPPPRRPRPRPWRRAGWTWPSCRRRTSSAPAAGWPFW